MSYTVTKGSVLKTLIRFSIPFIFSYFLQTLYGMADLFIIGQFYKVESITAVSIGSQIMHMITVMIVGLAMGTIVTVGRAVGANKKEEVDCYIGNSIVLFCLLALISTIVLISFIDPIITLMSTPVEAVQDTKQYLWICFLGIPFITSYNLLSAIFRGMGDSKHPMYIIAIACFFNIVLDYVFIGGCHFGVAGAAMATILAQLFSVIIACVFMIKKRVANLPSRHDFLLRSSVVKELASIGIPIMLQDGCIQIAFLIITIFVNHRGLYDSAAVGIVEKMICLLFLVPSSMLQSVSSLSAINLGARKLERAHKILSYACIITIIWGLVIVCVMHVYIPCLMQFFTSEKQVIMLGSQYMKGYVWDCIFAGLHFSFSGYFCAYGLSGLSFLHNIISIVCVRIPCSYLAATRCLDSLYPMGLAVSFGSFVSVIICLVVYRWMKPREAILIKRIANA